MSTHKKLISLGAAAVLALGLAACGSGGGPTTAPPPAPKTVDLSGLTSGYQLTAGEYEIKAGASADSSDVKFTCATGGDDCVVTVSSAGGVTSTGGEVTASDSDGFTARLASELAEAKLVVAAIKPGSTKADANNDSEDGNQLPFTINGGMVTTTSPETPDNTDDDLKKSDDRPAAITGWTGSIHTRKTAADDTTDPVTLAKDDKVVSYTDLMAPGTAAYKTYYAAGSSDNLPGNAPDASDVDGDTFVDWTGVATAADVDHDSNADTAQRRVLTLSGSAIAKDDVGRLFAAADFGAGQTKLPPNGAGDSTTRTYDDTDSTADGVQVAITGTFHGVAGTFKCVGGADDTCTVTNAGGALTFSSQNAVWTFVPDDDSGDVAGVRKDVDFIDFGYWLETTTASDGTKSHKVLAFGFGERDYGTVENVDGKASYAGKATGLYVKKMTFGSTSSDLLRAISGQFTADAALEAVFGGSSVAPDDAFKIKGAVTSFMDAQGKMIDSAWTVELMEAGIGTAVSNTTGYDGTSGTFSGKTTGGGDWGGAFYGAGGSDNAQPVGVSGTFDGHFSNGHVYGAYGANKTE